MNVWNGQSFYPAKQIIKNLWIGSEKDAADMAFMKKHNIRFIVNATDSVPVYAKDIKSLRIPVGDDPYYSEKMGKYIPIAVIAIHDVLSHGHGVLVHCRAGMNRSATVVAGYLMFKKGMTAQKAMAFIKRKKPECFTPMNFAGALNAWEARLRLNGKIKD
jgi:dual specificity MAP kinase phosphatase